MGTREVMNEGSEGNCPLDALPEDVWRQIFKLLPHVTRLQIRCVSQKWKRILTEVEADRPARNQGCLALEQVEDRPGGTYRVRNLWRMWDLFAPAFVSMETSLPVTPPGVVAQPHGAIRGGGSSGLVAFRDEGCKEYWIGSPVHNKWEKVREPRAFSKVRFHCLNFHLVAEQKTGFYKLVQFMWNEKNRYAKDRGPNFVVQVYSSRFRVWTTEEKADAHDQVVFWQLYYSCVSENKVYFLGSVKPSGKARSRAYFKVLKTILGPPEPELCPAVIWAFDVDTCALSEVRPPGKLSFQVEGVQVYGRSVQLHVIGPAAADFKISIVGEAVLPTPENRICVFGQDKHRNWVLEKEVAVGNHAMKSFYLEGGCYLGYDASDLLHQDHPSLSSTSGTSSPSIGSLGKDHKKWGQVSLANLCGPYVDPELPVLPFLPCECSFQETCPSQRPWLTSDFEGARSV